MNAELTLERSQTLETLLAGTLVGVVRDRDEVRAEKIAIGLLDAGFRAIEVTATTPKCFEIIHRINQRVRQPRVVLGVGTIRSLAALKMARNAGARYVVSPHTDPELIRAALELNLVVIPGAMTPTEILTARNAGADIIKLFPISAMGGPAYLRLIRGPMADVPVWVSGDVSLEEIPTFVESGASLIGLTSALTADLPEDPIAEVHKRAAKALEVLLLAREGAPQLKVNGPTRSLNLGLKQLRKLPGPEHTTLSALIPDRRGHAVRIRMVLQSVGAPETAQIKLTSTDGFSRTVPAKALYEGGFVQYAIDGQPLDRKGGGPLRLYIIGGPDQCDNVKGLSQIDVL